MMGTGEKRRGHLCSAEDAGPFAEAEVGSDDDTGALVELVLSHRFYVNRHVVVVPDDQDIPDV